MKYIVPLVILVVAWVGLIQTKNQLDDCQFECKNLQTRLTRCQELSDCAEALEQTLPSLAWAQVRAINEEIKQKRHWKYRGTEQPLLIEKK